VSCARLPPSTFACPYRTPACRSWLPQGRFIDLPRDYFPLAPLLQAFVGGYRRVPLFISFPDSFFYIVDSFFYPLPVRLALHLGVLTKDIRREKRFLAIVLSLATCDLIALKSLSPSRFFDLFSSGADSLAVWFDLPMLKASGRVPYHVLPFPRQIFIPDLKHVRLSTLFPQSVVPPGLSSP